MGKKQKKTMVFHRRAMGFTLIELLVVVAIIALLMAVVLPALRKAKEQAKMVICSSNMKQVVYGLVTYTNDEDGKLPPSSSEVLSIPGAYHRPTELSWYDNQVGVRPVALQQYVGRYLGGYLPDAGVFNCPVAPIKKGSEWPPRTSGLPAEGTYGEFYLSGTYAPLHSTYTLLWNYQGYNHKVSVAVDKTKKHFEAPSKISDSNKLVIQDTFKFLTINDNLLFPTPQDSWYSSHRFREATKAKPYFVLPDPSQTQRPSCKLSAGYLDGRVDRYNSADAIEVKNFQAINYLSPQFR